MLSITLTRDIPNAQLGGLVLAEFINSEVIINPDEANDKTSKIDITLILKHLDTKIHLINDYALFRIANMILDNLNDLPFINAFISYSSTRKNVDKFILRKFIKFMHEKLGASEEQIINSLRLYNKTNTEYYRCFELNPKLRTREHLSIFCDTIVVYVSQL